VDEIFVTVAVFQGFLWKNIDREATCGYCEQQKNLSVHGFDGMIVLNSKVLVLNRSYFPIHVTSVRRAFSLLYQGIAQAVDQEYRTFDYDSWSALSASLHDDTITLVDRAVRVPRVILLVAYDRVPKRHVRFSRFNVFARDKNTCQYCGLRFPRSELNLDHVVPRSRGGLSTWENVVCSCFSCNRIKGGQLPEEARMRLIRRPFRPEWTPFMLETFSFKRYQEWLPYLSAVDAAYWNTELLER
jgi:5-methylcytosine-specific restriction endonuclease McrA